MARDSANWWSAWSGRRGRYPPPRVLPAESLVAAARFRVGLVAGDDRLWVEPDELVGVGVVEHARELVRPVVLVVAEVLPERRRWWSPSNGCLVATPRIPTCWTRPVRGSASTMLIAQCGLSSIRLGIECQDGLTANQTARSSQRNHTGEARGWPPSTVARWANSGRARNSSSGTSSVFSPTFMTRVGNGDLEKTTVGPGVTVPGGIVRGGRDDGG